MKFIKSIRLFIVPVLLIACAQQKVMVGESLKPFEGFDSTSSAPFATKPIKIATVTDARPTKMVEEAIGEARTGAQFKRTPVLTSQPPEEFVRSYMEKGLKLREFLLVENDAKVLLNVVVNELWVEEVIEKYKPERAKCKVALQINGEKQGETFSENYTGNFWAEITSPGDMGDGTEKIEPTLASCMNAVMEKIAKEEKFLAFIKAQPLI